MSFRFRTLALVAVPLVAMGLVLPAGSAASAAPSAPVVTTAQPWTLTPDPVGFSPAASQFYADSCVLANFCMAVGYSSPGVHDAPLAEIWNGSSWTVTTTPNPTGGAYLYGVSCTSTTFCIAVGWTDDASPSVPVVDQWNGSSWASVTVPATSSNTQGLDSVSCTSTTFCVATGYVRLPMEKASSLIETWNGSTWQSTPSADPAGLSAFMEGVSCASVTFCVSTGYTEDASFNDLPLSEVWNGSVWALQTMNIPSGDVAADMDGVSCLSSSFCVADGFSGPSFSGDFDETPLIEQWNGSAWSIQAAPSIGFGDYFYGVSCATVDSCTAVGSYYTTSGDYDSYNNDALVWNGATWSRVAVANANSPANYLENVSCLSGVSCLAIGASYDESIHENEPTGVIAPLARTGYRFVASDGGIFSFGAPFYGSMGGQALNAPIADMADMPDGGGYYEVASDGGVFAFGNAQFYGSMGGKPLNKPIVGIAVTPDGLGYWEVASDGGLFSFGDATFYGSMGGKPLNEPIVGMGAIPTGRGYYEVASDGGIFAFGDATFAGSMGGKPLNKPIVGLGVTASEGYYEVASDGGMFAFGGAPFFGSMGGQPLNSPIVGFATDPAGGYYEVGADGGIFAFGGVPFLGSMGGKPLNEPIVGMAT